MDDLHIHDSLSPRLVSTSKFLNIFMSLKV